MELEIDIEQLKKDLIDYFGSAVPYNGVAIMDVIAVEHADAEELVNIALQNGFNLDDYVGGLKLYGDFDEEKTKCCFRKIF